MSTARHTGKRSGHRVLAGPSALTRLRSLAWAVGLWGTAAMASLDPMSPLPGMPSFPSSKQGRPAGELVPAGRTDAAVASHAASGSLGAPVAAQAPAHEPRLVALRSNSDGKRDALIEDRWVRAGDSTPWGRVLAVHADRVDLGTGSRQSARARGATAREAGSGMRSLYLLPRLLPTPKEASDSPLASTALRTSTP